VLKKVPTVKKGSTLPSPCNVYYSFVERQGGNVFVHPLGDLHDTNWLDDERISAAIDQLDHGFLYLNCAEMRPFSESLGWFLRFYKRLASRASRLILCSLHPELEEIVRTTILGRGPPAGFLSYFDIQDGGLPGSWPRLPDSSCLAWNNSTIPKMAQAIYEARAYDRLPILADALEEAGCSKEDLLSHCRQGGEHVEGCWLIDLLRRTK
jgi:anti-anti-sigma regulatory factor